MVKDNRECSQRDSVGEDERCIDIRGSRTCLTCRMVSLVGVWSIVPSWSAQCQPPPPLQRGPPAPLPAHLLLQWEATHTPLRLDGHNMAATYQPIHSPEWGEKGRQLSEMKEKMNGMEKNGEHIYMCVCVWKKGRCRKGGNINLCFNMWIFWGSFTTALAFCIQHFFSLYRSVTMHASGEWISDETLQGLKKKK